MKNKKIGDYNSHKPEAWIAVSNNRQKIYGTKNDLVYLDDGQEFQIELFNPDKIPYLVKIYLNDGLISSSGLILNPGQRYFLDRYIDEKKKFLFSTYEVENTAEIKEAIKNNGKVRVEFYPEQKISTWPNTYVWPQTTWPQTWTSYYQSYPSNTSVNFCNGDAVEFTTTNSTNTLMSVNNCCSYSSEYKSTKETGRVERGGESSQNFEWGTGNYSSIFKYSSEYQIFPRSAKPTEISEIRSYCTQCGSRIKKKSWKFCPGCGGSLD